MTTSLVSGTGGIVAGRLAPGFVARLVPGRGAAGQAATPARAG